MKREKACSHRQILISVSAVSVILLLAVCLCSFGVMSAYPEKRKTLKLLENSDYESVFLSMYDVSSFSNELFTTNKGIPTLQPDYLLRNTNELNEALESAFASGNNITHIFLGLNPFSFRPSSSASAETAFLKENDWIAHIDANPHVTFEILFPFPSVEYWLSLTAADRSRILTLYEKAVYLLDTRSNVIMYCAGGEDWLICNPSNYTGSFTVNSQVSEKIFLYTFCDGNFQITSENVSETLLQIQNIIESGDDVPAEYPDLSQYDIVFIGDSILGKDTGTLSFEGIISAFSGASVFNCAQGGSSAAEQTPEKLSFPGIVSEFLAGQPELPDTVYGQSILKYGSFDHSDKRTCFLISFGLNDYFCGLPLDNPSNPADIHTYAGAMRTAITDLQKRYPNALYIIMGPSRITAFQNGTELVNGKNCLYDYSAAAASLADELGAFHLDLYNEFPDKTESPADVLLADGVHYNEHGRFILSQRIISLISDL